MQEFVNSLVIGFISQPIFWIIIIGAIITTIFYKKIIGFMGEFWVKTELIKLPKKDYLILNNLMLKANNTTHQIDHVVLSKYGIFVIETKNYDGLITGDKYKDKWCQHLGKNKYYFNNPIHQNYGHIKALEEVLNIDKDKFISIICMSNRAKIKVNDKNVVQLDDLKNLIKSYDKEILTENLYNLKGILLSKNITDKDSKKTHIKEIKENIKLKEEKENDMICPKCGGKLVKRSGKYGDFIGCSNYPKCKYIKK